MRVRIHMRSDNCIPSSLKRSQHAGGKCPKGDNLECKNDVCVEKPAACGDLDWPCCNEYGPEGAS